MNSFIHGAALCIWPGFLCSDRCSGQNGLCASRTIETVRQVHAQPPLFDVRSLQQWMCDLYIIYASTISTT
jgi:hypothetical protein